MNQDQIKNFVILSHIDHGKSTLADRLLELTGTISPNKMKPQFLDMMDLESEKGITIKMHPVRMKWQLPEDFKKFLHFDFSILNLIDTPGHVDFSYEVSRSLAAVEGAILLVDATKGIQAQTLANLELAKKQNLIIIPAINKIDLPQARVEESKNELANLLKIDKEQILEISAKYGTNVDKLLARIIKEVPPPPKENFEKPLRALIFDSKYDSYKGVIAYVRVMEGSVEKNEKIKLLATKGEGEVKEIGYFSPELSPQKQLFAGEIGYIATGIKEPDKVRVGDTITKLKIENEKLKNGEVGPLSGYRRPQPMVFASFYPENADDFDLLKESLLKLKLNDPALVFEQESKESLGRGFRCGFLGTLHAEIVSERLRREFGLGIVISAPSVMYKIINPKNEEKFIYSATDWPNQTQIKEVEEPWVNLEILTPVKHLGQVSELFKKIKGNYIETEYFSQNTILLLYEVPLREVITNFYDKLKSLTQGYASMSYEIFGYRKADLVKMDILIAGKEESALSKIIPQQEAYEEGKNLVKKLKEVLPAQQFSLALQAVVGGKIIARETIKSRRKDVTGYLYGGDVTRKKKLLAKQKKGKKRMRESGRVRIPPKAFLEIFKTR